MKYTASSDPIVIEALSALDSGNTGKLLDLIDNNPRLVSQRIRNNEEGYFKDPYLLYFIADNPIRTDRLPKNITEITSELVRSVKQNSPETYQSQIDYTLSLVASGRIPKECGVQIELLDLLIDAGASPDCPMVALTHGNLEAAEYLLSRGATLTLALAVCLERTVEIQWLADHSTPNEKLTALAAAAFYGKADSIKTLLQMNTDPNGFPDRENGFHTHATPLHQAVYSGSIASVQLLVEAGANIDAPDRIYHGNPTGLGNPYAFRIHRPSKPIQLRRHRSIPPQYKTLNA